MTTVPLSRLFASARAGYWGSAPDEAEANVLVVRNGDLRADNTIAWSQLPTRGLKTVEVQKAQIHAEDILMTTSGNCGTTARLSSEPPSPTCATNFVRVLRPDTTIVESRYLAHFMKSPVFFNGIQPYIRGTTLQNLSTQAALEAVHCPLPELPEQRRIADILDRADTVRASRRRSVGLLNELSRSIFLDMFAAQESRAWSTTTVGQLVDEEEGGIRTGPFGSQLLHSEFVDEGIPVLGIDNVVENRFTWGKARHITEQKYRELRRYTVRPGDVLITIMGTCGRAAVAPDDIPVAVNTKHLCCITLDQTKCLPSFLHGYFLFHPEARSYLERTAKGAIMSGLNMGLIKALPVRLPSIELQRQFVAILATVRRHAAMQETGEREGEIVVASLQHRAFRGEL